MERGGAMSSPGPAYNREKIRHSFFNPCMFIHYFGQENTIPEDLLKKPCPQLCESVCGGVLLHSFFLNVLHRFLNTCLYIAGIQDP